jgi:hypothetical protein
VLEALAIEGYRSGKLTHYQASRLLRMSRFEFDGFLKDRQIYDHAYSVDDSEQDPIVLQLRGCDTPATVMIAVVADTSPLNYLIQIHCQDLLPLYGRVLAPLAPTWKLSIQLGLPPCASD